MATITFHTEYRTLWGEEIRVRWWTDTPQEPNAAQALCLSTPDGIHWQGTLHTPLPPGTTLHYYYLLTKDGQPQTEEWHLFPRYLELGEEARSCHTYDQWKLVSGQLHFYSSAFTECLMARPPHHAPVRHYRRQLTLKVHCPRVDSHHALALCGNQPALGDWDPAHAVPLDDTHAPEWQVHLDAETLSAPLEYKFVLLNLQTGQVEAWELHDNRHLSLPLPADGETVVAADHYAYFDQPMWRGAGTAIPVFALRSTRSFGIGDFGDLRLMVDWAVCTHQKILQLLPVNDTTMGHTWMDSYPYNSISIFALHPIYLDLAQMGEIKDPSARAHYQQLQQELNALPSVDYEAVEHAKWDVFRILYAQNGPQTLAQPECQEFLRRNSHWLRPYAAYSYLRDRYCTADFRQWPTHSRYQADEVEQLCREHRAETDFFCYLQFHLHRQLLTVSSHARRHGVILKGDIPIGISRCSVEAWAEPQLFHMDGQAGAPPDDFSVNGQNWGFPTYNWAEMEKDGYRWWMRRFQKMAEYFDAYRIDHILGFFRIWEIPQHAVHGLLGQFSPSLPLSREEIEAYGLPFHETLYTMPYIHTLILRDLFGEQAERVVREYLQPLDEKDRYQLLPAFDTQRKVEAHFRDKPAEHALRDGLYTLISNVLFVRDKDNPQRFHPRIGVQKDYVFQLLTAPEREAFNRLYEQYYYHRHNLYWQQQALRKLPRLTASTRMLVCGEDLGMIPACVGWVMNDLQILSLEIQRMPKEPYHEFGDPARYPYRSVSTLSTHDMSTLRGWWRESPSQIQRFYQQELHHTGTAPQEASGPLCQELLAQQLRGNSMLCILAWQDWLSIDEALRLPDADAERINIPSHPRHYWRYRMHLTLEELLRADGLNRRIRQLIDDNGRNPQS